MYNIKIVLKVKFDNDEKLTNVFKVCSSKCVSFYLPVCREGFYKPDSLSTCQSSCIFICSAVTFAVKLITHKPVYILKTLIIVRWNLSIFTIKHVITN